jgi:hypothetical protein
MKRSVTPVSSSDPATHVLSFNGIRFLNRPQLLTR